MKIIVQYYSMLSTYHSGLAYKLGVAQNKSEAVVVDVEKGQIMALENQKNGIEELPDFEEIVDVVQGLQTTIENLNTAYRGEKTTFLKRWEHLGGEAQQEQEWTNGKNEVVHKRNSL